MRADDWFLYEIDSPSASAGPALCTGEIWAADGTHVATVVQEGLIRSLDQEDPAAHRASQAPRGTPRPGRSLTSPRPGRGR
jgi:hypothetical protein